LNTVAFSTPSVIHFCRRHVAALASALSFAIGLAIVFASLNSFAQSIPDIRHLPRLSANLPKGTIAWATIDQLHPLQPQTGKREVTDKEAKFENLLRTNFEKFSPDLYEYLYSKTMIPVFIGKTPRSDSRYGKEKILGFASDRTHTANAMAELIEYYYGKRGLREPIYDAKDRPVNVVIVRVASNLSGYTPTRFANAMVKNNHGYFVNWSQADDGSTVLEPITFKQLPEKVYQTTDNPFRSVISSLIHNNDIQKRNTDFYQFRKAEKLANAEVVTWDSISEDASDKNYRRAVDDCADFFNSNR
jgi:hypothetical protein